MRGKIPRVCAGTITHETGAYIPYGILSAQQFPDPLARGPIRSGKSEAVNIGLYQYGCQNSPFVVRGRPAGSMPSNA